MLDETTVTSPDQSTAGTPDSAGDGATGEADSPRPRQRRRAASRPAGPPETAAAGAVDAAPDAGSGGEPPAAKTAKKTAKKTARKAARKSAPADAGADALDEAAPSAADAKPKKAVKAKKTAQTKKSDNSDGSGESDSRAESATSDPTAPAPPTEEPDAASAASGVALLFQAPETVQPRSRKESAKVGAERAAPDDDAHDTGAGGDDAPVVREDDPESSRRRRSRGGRNRRKSGAEVAPTTADGDIEVDEPGTEQSDAPPASSDEQTGGSSRRRRRRRRSGEEADDTSDDPAATVVKVRPPRKASESISSVEGSTRIEAKKQRRREGREAGRRRPPILSESEFLARRESVDRTMVIRQRGEVTQIAVLEDNILVEHYVALESQTSLIGNVYLGRVQNVLPSMEAAFIDIGRGRNAVLYAGEVDWALVGEANQPRRIENALKPGQAVLVQVSKDPVGHKGARLTSQISLPGRYLVYVPGGGTSGISRKLPDTERTRLKTLLKEILPEDAGVIIRTAAEGASEDELTRDVTRLTARWEDIEKKAKSGQAPALLYAEPDTTLKVVRDLFTEDFGKLVISGDDAWDMVDGYVQYVAPDLADRLERHEGDDDVFEKFRIDEQIAKALERKVWLPSGGSLVIDRTEAMTVVDVNTGKFTGSGGNLEETVTKNNLEAAEEIVRQLRLRDIGGIIVIDFIDMVLEGNRDLVLRRLVECLGRDRTRHQVAEVTSLGLVQMTRKRIGTGLLEAFSHTCEHCQGRGVVIESEPVEPRRRDSGHGGSDSGSSSRGSSRRSGRGRRGRRGGGGGDSSADKSESSDSGSESQEPATADA
jgi:ribonuclease E